MAELLTQWALNAPVAGGARGVVQTFAAESPLFDVLRLMDLGEQDTYEYNREASLGGVGFRNLNEEYSDAASTSGIVNPIVETTRIFGGMVKTDRQKLSTKASRMAMKAKAAARRLVKNFIKGNAAAALGGAGVDVSGFDGLYVRIKAAQTIYAGDNGAAITTALVDELLDLVHGENGGKVLLMCKALRRRFAQKIRAEGATSIGLAEWAGTLTPTAYNGARIIVPEKDESNAEIMDFDETRGTSKVTASVVCFRPGEADEEDVQLIGKKAGSGLFEVENQGVRGTQDWALVEGKVGLAVFHGEAAARLGGVLNT